MEYENHPNPTGECAEDAEEAGKDLVHGPRTGVRERNSHKRGIDFPELNALDKPCEMIIRDAATKEYLKLPGHATILEIGRFVEHGTDCLQDL